MSNFSRGDWECDGRVPPQRSSKPQSVNWSMPSELQRPSKGSLLRSRSQSSRSQKILSAPGRSQQRLGSYPAAFAGAAVVREAWQPFSEPGTSTSSTTTASGSPRQKERSLPAASGAETPRQDSLNWSMQSKAEVSTASARCCCA